LGSPTNITNNILNNNETTNNTNSLGKYIYKYKMHIYAMKLHDTLKG